MCQLCFCYPLLKDIQYNLFENRNIVKIQQPGAPLLVTVYLASGSVKIAWCSENQAEKGRERKTTKREGGKKALSRYKIQESQMVAEPETSRGVELSQTANSWISPDCL